MLNTFLYIFGRIQKTILLLFVLGGVCRAQDNAWIESHFAVAEAGFQERWQAFGQTKFDLWSPKWKELELKQHFTELLRQRWEVFFTSNELFGQKDAVGTYRPDYATPPVEVWKTWFSRYPYPPVVFQYNLAVPDYNASLVTINGQRFIAMEAPTKENLDAFYRCINDYKVDPLVRLTPARSGLKDCSVPYWEGRITGNQVEIGNRKVHYVMTDNWLEHEAIDPHELIKLIYAAKHLVKDNGVIGVHCRAGVGRTGTFIVGYCLVTEIDALLDQKVSKKDIRVSIDKFFWQLSLQRSFTCNRFLYYWTLHRLVDVKLGNALRQM
ncbi:MAG TPA: hypothetical protein DHV51_02095 [Opitutae bacterium]|nr:hypothetical protein [Opitutae bacterium]